MKRWILLVVMIAMLPATLWARKTTTITTNHRFNSVKLSEVSLKEAEKRGISHPVDVDEARLRDILASIKLSKQYLVRKDVASQEVLSEAAVDFLAPNLAAAFRKAAVTDEVLFSYLVKRPDFIMRNDRLTVGRAWIHGDEVHILFDKLYAKVTGDTDKRGNEAKLAARARGLRVSLALEPGQRMSPQNPDELIVTLTPPPAEAVPAEKTTKGERSTVEAEVADPTATNVEGRLQELKDLKEKGLITKKEYETKRKEILSDL
ncbi:MAG: SHOCT domain-containing protein [Deltaproteobacteria bacterium]|nr:SHOCT domain-containing protein [Deltaproteobacteria bacterium]